MMPLNRAPATSIRELTAPTFQPPSKPSRRNVTNNTVQIAQAAVSTPPVTKNQFGIEKTQSCERTGRLAVALTTSHNRSATSNRYFSFSGRNLSRASLWSSDQETVEKIRLIARGNSKDFCLTGVRSQGRETQGVTGIQLILRRRPQPRPERQFCAGRPRTPHERWKRVYPR